MKLLRSIILVFTFAAFVSCGSDDNEVPVFPLSAENIAANYKMTNLEVVEEQYTIVQSTDVLVSKATTTADTYQVDLILLANRTFTMEGEYRSTYTETITGNAPTTEVEIETVDGGGNYTIDVVNKELTLTFADLSTFQGRYKIDSFTENTLVLSRKEEVIIGSEKTTIDVKISFDRN
ncbi:hypothetical protein [Tenacibaculum sp. M341]|uniref:hypothetical protein n=1 Tax=Tenacibaculum sp. M341 TaxID=2530339 RepID=UPI0010527CBE|nr:hypothetical protein [Tenacibaculum sp. M341]TCI84789.1 hypothetical protein EYW44_19860 [Tenacibaculum sp. M341]